MKVYVVKAVRYGDFKSYSYNVEVFSDLMEAKVEAREEFIYRGGKYETFVYEFELNATNESEPEKECLFSMRDYL